jgi:hypothetical protein
MPNATPDQTDEPGRSIGWPRIPSRAVASAIYRCFGGRRGGFPGSEQPSKDWRNPGGHDRLHVTLPETYHALGLNRQALAHQGARTP